MDRAKARERAKSLVARMTLEEKAGQLRYDAPFGPSEGPVAESGMIPLAPASGRVRVEVT